VAGFRELGPPVVIADREHFTGAVSAALAGAGPAGAPTGFDNLPVPSWHQRAESMVSLMTRVRRQAADQKADQ
jgi:hypothetical protein